MPIVSPNSKSLRRLSNVFLILTVRTIFHLQHAQ